MKRRKGRGVDPAWGDGESGCDVSTAPDPESPNTAAEQVSPRRPRYAKSAFRCSKCKATLIDLFTVEDDEPGSTRRHLIHTGEIMSFIGIDVARSYPRLVHPFTMNGDCEPYEPSPGFAMYSEHIERVPTLESLERDLRFMSERLAEHEGLRKHPKTDG